MDMLVAILDQGGAVLGGLGLFLIAMALITDGLKLAAGDALADLLGTWTKTTGRGILSGILITSFVQSSSAVTVATIGFVNAGILSLSQAIGVVYGSNVGTTLTAWLVSAVGFNVKIDAFALPLIGFGMLLRLGGKQTKRSAIGLTLVGFGLFFLGIDILKDTFEHLAQSHRFEPFSSSDFTNVLLFLFVGFVLTLFTQSSSAAMAIILTAVSGGVITFFAGVAMVIGANIGTTSTALLAVIGSSPNAKRVAAAHVLFNVITAAVALALWPLLLMLIDSTSEALHLGGSPAMSLALFHSVFNVLGILVLWPATPYLTAFLDRCFISFAEIEGKPRYLDKTVIATPELALNSIALELTHVAEISRRMSKAAISTEMTSGDKLANEYAALQRLVQEIEEFVGRLGSGSLPDDVASELPGALRCSQYLSAVAEFATLIDNAQMKIHALTDEALATTLTQFRLEMVAFVESSDVTSETFSVDACEANLIRIEDHYQKLREQLLVAGAHQRVKIRDMTFTSEQLTRMHRLSEQLMKATRLQAHLQEVTQLTGERMSAKAGESEERGST